MNKLRRVIKAQVYRHLDMISILSQHVKKRAVKMKIVFGKTLLSSLYPQFLIEVSKDKELSCLAQKANNEK